MTNPRWRVGRKLGRTLYRDDQVVGMVDTPEIAAEIVAAMNLAEHNAKAAGWVAQDNPSLVPIPRPPSVTLTADQADELIGEKCTCRLFGNTGVPSDDDPNCPKHGQVKECTCPQHAGDPLWPKTDYNCPKHGRSP
jgi:hypothetical protein